jgi:hypothetical protein
METFVAALMHKTMAVVVKFIAVAFQKWIESGPNGHSFEFPRQNDKINKSRSCPCGFLRGTDRAAE